MLQVCDVHGPALAGAQTLSFPQDLEHHVLRIAAFGNAVSVAAMC